MQRALAIQTHFDIGRGPCIAAGTDRVLVVIHDLQLHWQAGDQRFQRPLADPAPVHGFTLAGDFHLHGAGAVFFLQTMAFQGVRRRGLQVFTLEQGIDLLGVHLQSQTIGFLLHHLAELDLHPARQADAVLLLQQVGDAAFAGLTVDANHRLVAATDVSRVDWQVGHFPHAIRILLAEAFANRVLV